MRTIITLTCISIVSLGLTGCDQGDQGELGELLTVDFKEGSALRYKLISERSTEVNLDSTGSASKSGKNKPQKMSEKLELVIAYRPVVIDPYGLSTIEGTCESARITRKSLVRKAPPSDAVESLAGQTFTFQISPTGQIADYAQLKALVRRLGDRAFAPNARGQGRIKNPDMISDFVALQWHLWDSIATIKNAVDGVAIGQTWKAKQLIPLPMPIQVARESTYTLAEVKDTDSGRKAVITSSYKLSNSRPKNRPMPYTGKFMMKGMFGFLRNFKPLWIEGSGRQIFDIDAGVVESEQQQYKVKIQAGFMLPLGDTVPTVTTDQKMSIQLIAE